MLGKPPTRYIPVLEWPKYHPWPSVSGLRNMIFYAEEKGFDHVVKRIGKRVLIDETAFMEWMDNQ